MLVGIGLALVLVFGWAAAAAPASAALARQGGPIHVSYVEPVDAPVIDWFRPPPTPYGPGNRGWEYATTPGAAVRSAADGEVTFAGAVASNRAVTIRHGDGMRTSYSFLASVEVREGTRVRQGDVVGTATARLHFSLRRGEVYLDPATIFDRSVRTRPGARLVPVTPRATTR